MVVTAGIITLAVSTLLLAVCALLGWTVEKLFPGKLDKLVARISGEEEVN